MLFVRRGMGSTADNAVDRGRNASGKMQAGEFLAIPGGNPVVIAGNLVDGLEDRVNGA
jgi:hypothetical protein